MFRSTNGGTNWEDVSGDFGMVPVFDMGQNWRTWDEGCFKPGAIYIACHGRGIWSTDEYLGATQFKMEQTSKSLYQTLQFILIRLVLKELSILI